MIALTSQLQAASELLTETEQTLSGYTVARLREIAKTLNIKGCYRMNKGAIVSACLAEIEGLRAMMAAAGMQAEKSQAAVVALKAEGGHIPVSEVVGKVYSRLKSILKESQGFEAIKERITALAATIARSELREHKVSTAIKTRRPQIKKGLVDTAHANEGMMQQDVLDAIDIFYAAMCAYQKDDSILLNKSYKISTVAKNKDKQDIAIAALAKECQITLDELANGGSPHWTKVTKALILGTGRRPCEVHHTAEFTVVNEYSLRFKGQAKTRDSDGSKDDFEIPTLYPAQLMVKALEYLGEQGKRLPLDFEGDSSKAVNKKYGMAHSRSMQKYPCPIKDIRKFYAELMWRIHATSSREKHTYFSEIMGHSNQEEGGNATYQSYLTYRVIDAESVIDNYYKG